MSTTSELVPARGLLAEAQRLKRAVPALNFYNAETLRAHIDAARELEVPLILQTTEATIDYLGLTLVVGMARAAAEELDTPVALHLDHGASFELAARAIDAGYSSVMIDGSSLVLEENVALTRRVVARARAAGVSVEAEIGHVGPALHQLSADCLTRPEDARRFAQETEVDSLAVAIGTQHGFYRGEVALDFERLAEIAAAVPGLPLVLHGGSGVSDELLQRAIALGIAKINFGTELKDAFTRGVRSSLSKSDEIDLRKTFAPALRAVAQVSAAKLRMCWGADARASR